MGLRNWLFRRRLRRSLLFGFHDGQRWRRMDGQRLWRRYRASHELMDPLMLKKLQEEDPETTERYLTAIADLFEVARYQWQTGTGLTDAELMELAVGFARWIEQKKT